MSHDEVLKPVASVSLDLDNRWVYLRTAGEAAWNEYPSYLDVVLPRALEVLAQHGLRATLFVIGRDAEDPANRELLASVAADHEVGNHSFDHDQRMHRWPEAELRDDFSRSEDAIEAAVGRKPQGFRGPGYTLSTAVLRVLAQRGYAYDASTLPTYVGPLARAYYFRTTRLDRSARNARAELFGHFSDGRRPLTPYYWVVDEREVLEIPVTTFPGLKVPIHLSYVLHLARYSPGLARFYVRAAVRACSAAGVAPSILLHPVDFLGPDDSPDLAFSPGMRTPAREKLDMIHAYLAAVTERFDLRPVGAHASDASRGATLRRLHPKFGDPPTCPSKATA
jgi:peptidoglycan-N-acetylglucosamine deacetylase